MKKIIISVAPVAAIEQKIDPTAIAEDVVRCYTAGASMVHLHVRDQNGHLTADLSVLKEIVRLIRKECDIIIQASTGGVSNLSIQERCAPVDVNWVEANSLNVGSVNLGDAVYQNPIKDVRYCLNQIIKNKKIPEIEVFEMGMIKTVKDLSMEYNFIKPILFSIVLGHYGAAPATKRTLQSMIDCLEEFFPKPENVLWGITHANRINFDFIGTALDMGASTVRIGFEDSDYLNETVHVRKNLALVEEVVRLLNIKQMQPATCQEAREMLHIPTPRER